MGLDMTKGAQVLRPPMLLGMGGLSKMEGRSMVIKDFERPEKIKGPSDRSFGWVFTAFFMLVALMPLIERHPVRLWALSASGVFLLFTMLRPQTLAPLNLVWTRLGALLHRLVSPVALGIVFYLTVMPMGFLLRMAGKDLLRLKADSQAKSYWIPREPPGPDPKNMKHLF